jgi:hypothetical protein
MTNEITKRNATEVSAKPAGNPFLEYADAISHRNIVGTLLRFVKGEYYINQDGVDVEVPHGTTFIANMDEMLAGWIRWEDSKPTDHIMGKVVNHYQPPPRNTLGDLDKTMWETYDNGDPRDPWQLSNYLLLKNTETGELYTFTASSQGGLSAVGNLLRAYGTAMAQRPKEYPIVALGGSSYPHKIKSRGRVKVPVFKVVGWSKKAEFGDVTDTRDNDPEDDVAEELQDQIVEFPEPVKTKSTKGKPHGRI